MMRQYELVERVRSYDPDADEDAINRAYVFTVKAHGAQKRASGDPYFSHPVEVAGILTDYRLDTASIITALLHDTVEDTLTSLDEIERLFGPEVGRLVDGVTKLSRIELQSDRTSQAENLRKLVLAMSQDIRVLLVKLADRLHNMATLKFIADPAKRARIARETMEIYAPLAERIGMHAIQERLENLAFQELHADAHGAIAQRLEKLRAADGETVEKIVKALRDNLAIDGIRAAVSGREKAPYSIWRKMQRKNVGFEELSDIMAFRVVVDDVADCYRALGSVHSHYKVVPGRFKDYISTPKPNGYRSLHTGILGPEGRRIEIQIRTQSMHEIAEMGVAAHWSYKTGEKPTDANQYRWLRELLDIIEHAPDPDEFLEHTKMAMFQDKVFCFSPKGDLIELPRGATPIDFAYAVHSAVGDHCVGAKINGKMMPLRSELTNGDQVEIITSNAQVPSPTWERMVVTGKARARIRRFIRMQQRAQFSSLGRAMLQKAFRQEGYEFTEKAIDESLKSFKVDEAEDLYAKVGEGLVTAREVLTTIFPEIREQRAPALPQIKAKPTPKKDDAKKRNSIPIKGLIDGVAVRYAKCCHPLPGDRIVGIVTTGRGVTVHTIDCDTLDEFQEQPERWLDLSWEAGEEVAQRIGRLNIVLANEPGALASLSTVISKNGGNISNLKITQRNQQFWEMLIDLEVRDLKHLTNILAALRATPAVNAVDRARG